MTEEPYAAPVASFKVNAAPAPVFTIPVCAEGRAALERINEVSGLLLAGARWWRRQLAAGAVRAAPASCALLRSVSCATGLRHQLLECSSAAAGMRRPPRPRDASCAAHTPLPCGR
jgi:hypothetical protein